MLPQSERPYQREFPFPIGALSCPLPYSDRKRRDLRSKNSSQFRYYRESFERFINRAVAYRLLEWSADFSFYKIRNEISQFGIDESYNDALSDAGRRYR